MSVVTCMVRNLLFELFIVPCLQRFFCFPCHIFLKPFFIHCTPHWLPLLSSVLARFKKKFCFCFNLIFLISEGCCEHGWGGGGGGSVFFDRRSLQNLSFELAETYVHSVGATKTMAAAARLCRRRRWSSVPHSSSAHVIPETSNKTMGMKTFSHNTLLLLIYQSTIIFFLLFQIN